MLRVTQGQKFFYWLVGSMVIVGLIASTGCRKKKSSDSSDGEDAVEEESTENVSQSYPGGLSLSVLSTSGSSLRLADEEEAKSYAEEVKEEDKMLRGEGDCLPPIHNKIKAQVKGSEVCYEFDQDMIWGGMQNGGTPPATTAYNGTQNGLNASSEACMPAFARVQVDEIEQMVKSSKAFLAAALCQLKKDAPESKLPEKEGDKLSLEEPLASVMGSRITKINVAEIKRLKDTEGKDPVYLTLFSFEDKLGRPQVIRLIHSPDKDGNAEGFEGQLTMSMEGDPQDEKKASGSDAKYRVLSLAYKKTKKSDTESNLVAELRTGQVINTLFDEAFDENLKVNFNAGVGTNFDIATSHADYGKFKDFSLEQQNSAWDKMKFVAFDITQEEDKDGNKDVTEGKLGYWMNPGGKYKESARGFNITMVKDEDGGFSGEAVSGATAADLGNGISIRRFLHESLDDDSVTLKAIAFSHPFFNSGSAGSDSYGIPYTKTVGPSSAKWYKTKTGTANDTTFSTSANGTLVTRQCFERESATVPWDISASTCGDNPAGFDLLNTASTSDLEKVADLPEATAATAEPAYAETNDVADEVEEALKRD